MDCLSVLFVGLALLFEEVAGCVVEPAEVIDEPAVLSVRPTFEEVGCGLLDIVLPAAVVLLGVVELVPAFGGTGSLALEGALPLAELEPVLVVPPLLLPLPIAEASYCY